MDRVKGLYSQLKQLDDEANVENGANLDDIPMIYVAGNEEIIALANLFFIVDAPKPKLIADYATEKQLTFKKALEQILDMVFTSDKEHRPELNYGALLRQLVLTPMDVLNVKELLQNVSDISVRTMLSYSFCVSSALELLLAILYAEIDDDTLSRQYEAATWIPVPDVSEDAVTDDLLKEFDDELALVQNIQCNIGIESEDQLKRMTAAIAENDAEAEGIVNSIDVGIAEFARKMDAFDKKVSDMEAKCDEVINLDDLENEKPTDNVHDICEVDLENEERVTDDVIVLEDSDRKEEILTPTVRFTSTRPKSTTIPQGEVVEVNNISSGQLPLKKTKPSHMPPPDIDSECLAKRGKEWFAAGFIRLNMSHLPIVRYLDSTSEQAEVLKHQHHLAYKQPPSWFMDVGNLVVAPFDSPDGTSHWYSSIVAEQASSRNGGRYLVFNEFGDAKYIPFTDIRVLWRPPATDVWDDFGDPDVRDFLKTLIEAHPERALVRLKPRDFVNVLRDDGSFQRCSVEQVDIFMAKLHFPNGNYKWIYRGDRRLQPIHEQRMRSQAAKSGISSYVARRSRHHGGPVIEFVDDDDEGSDDERRRSSEAISVDTSPKRPQTARKRTSGICRAGIQQRFGSTNTGHGATATAIIQPLRREELIETTITFEERPLQPRPNIPCDENCIRSNPKAQQFKNRNPMSIPMLCGWSRVIKQNRKSKNISYISPCGHRQLGHKKVLQDFLLQTKCQLTIDLFDFTLHLDPGRTVSVKNPLVDIQDFTHGVENVRISCVNAITRDEPLFHGYERDRFSSDPAVDLEGAKVFCAGCDCKDNCADSKSCQCQRLTVNQAGKKKTRRNRQPVPIGYQFRRLTGGFIATGIYECNANCHCNHRCPNRVVQHPMLTKLQLFRSAHKGWGVRTLHDIPKGQLVCIYTGDILSDAKANELGKRQGDEYFAELDLIDCAEDAKEGYEPEVAESDSSESESDDDDQEQDYVVTGPRKRRKTRRFDSDDDEDEGTSGSTSNNMALPLSTPSAQATAWTIGKYLKESLFIIDAKVSGNIGRYLNHSCKPNIFVQNVFVDTHDLRLPWIAFFASEFIKAGTELAWDYNYTPLDGRKIICYCGAPNCRGRLL